MIVENLEIIDITDSGQGVAKKDNVVYFIDNVVIGETVDIKIIKNKKTFYIGEKVRTVKESQYKVEFDCKYSSECSGCTIHNTDYEKQLELKKDLVKNQISRIGNYNIENLNIVSLNKPYFFRNKIELKVDSNSNIGYYYKKSHKLVKIEKCIVASEAINKVIPKLSEIISKSDIKGYNYTTNKGIIKNITLRSNYLEEVQITLTLAKEDFKNKDKLFEEILKIEEVVELYYSVNTKKNSELMGEKVKLVKSNKIFKDKIGDYEFKISTKSFFQVNNKNTKNLYDIALKQMNLQGTENILDLYCGIGTTTIYFGNKAKNTVGVEIVKDAVKDANFNKELNNIENVEFVQGKSENEIEKLLNDNIDIVVVDPPRKGLDKNLIEILGNSNIKKLEYISCNPATLARDLKSLRECGFQIEEIELCDMFSHTMHVESVVLMTRKNG
ncbi:23S rRNA (uracil(1939)-C(5))-methyltransferase RlmD [Peptostreptococcaceae bacterium OttesenSCG-928-C18]|nr:23S rRNA (uracil(1939)-C(5))-methyltransferase RlmD [Peptostreptococcaceae bacterium OttesenSCG-928-C18]